jgi:O-antigen/teichoic acid export membrane protein
MVGRLELGRTIALPIIAITMLHLRVAQVTDAKNEYMFRDYFGTRLITSAIGFVIIAVIGLVGYGGEAGWTVLLWGLAKSIDSISDIVRGLFQRYERMNLSGVSLMVRSVFALVGASGIIWYFGNLLFAIVAIALAWLLALVLYDLPQAYRLLSAGSISEGVCRHLRPRFNIKTVLSLLRLTFPLGVIMFLLTLQRSVPRGVLEAYHGASALGYFGPIAYPIFMGTIVVNALGQSASPRLANYYVRDIKQYRRLMRKLLWLSVVMGLLFVAVVICVGKRVLTILYTVEYAEYHHEFIILAVGAAISFVSSFCGYGLAAARVFKTAMFLKIIPCASAVGISFLLIPSYGIRGAAFTLAVVFAVSLACSFTALFWIIKKRQEEIDKETC